MFCEGRALEQLLPLFAPSPKMVLFDHLPE